MQTNQEISGRPKKKLTWGQLKNLLESAGILNDDEIDTISISWGKIEEMEIKKDEIFGWQIYL